MEVVLVAIPEEVKLLAQYELARREFWYYCKLKAPDFYKKDRPFLQDMCNRLQKFIESDKKILVINLPPRPTREIKNSDLIYSMVIRNRQSSKDNDRII